MFKFKGPELEIQLVQGGSQFDGSLSNNEVDSKRKRNHGYNEKPLGCGKWEILTNH